MEAHRRQEVVRDSEAAGGRRGHHAPMDGNPAVHSEENVTIVRGKVSGPRMKKGAAAQTRVIELLRAACFFSRRCETPCSAHRVVCRV